MLSNLFSTDPDWTLTAIRVTLGVVFLAHGMQKALGWFGGAGLVAGLLSRVAAIGICAIMLSALVMVHARNGLFMNWFGDRKGHGIEYHLLALALAIAIVVRGSGALSLDRLLNLWQ